MSMMSCLPRRFWRGGCLVLLLATPFLAAQAEDLVDVSIRLVVRGDVELATLSGQGEAVWYGKTSRETQNFEIAASHPAALHLPRGRWLIRLAIPGFWAAPIQLELGAEATTVDAVLWPSGVVSGGFTDLPKGEPAPREVMVFFRPDPKVDKAKAPPPGRVTCPVDDDLAFSCKLPLGKFDLQFRVGSFIPRYAWGVQLASGSEKKLGRIDLRKGSSVLGWVATADDRSPLGTKITLKPYVGGAEPRQDMRDRLKSRRFKTTVNKQGFFQIDDLPPGAYILEARLLPFALKTTTVRVFEGQVTEVANPALVLELPRTLTLYIQPTVDPWGEPWQVELSEFNRRTQQTTRTLRGEAGYAGVYEQERLTPAEYIVHLQTSREQTWWSETIEMEAEDLSHSITTRIVDVRGTVTLGEDPLEAELMFGGRWGAVRLNTKSDEEGKFQLFLPREGDWQVGVTGHKPPIEREIHKVAIEAAEDTDRAWVELELPDTLVRGQVVNVLGNPVEAIVTLRSEANLANESVQRSTGEDGRFEMHGIPPGDALISADAGEGRFAEPMAFQVLKDADKQEPLVLTVENYIRLRGAVFSAAGPVPGVRVKVAPAETPYLSVRTATTDAQGRYELVVPPSVAEIHVVVAPPGFALRLLRTPVPKDHQLNLRVDQTVGTLIAELKEPVDWTDPTIPKPYLLRGSAVEGFSFLVSWAHSLGLDLSDRTRISLPFMEPGSYTACLATSAEYMGLALGVLPEGRCDSGKLLAGGTLVLRLKEK